MTQRLYIIRNLGTRLRFVRTSRFLIGSLHLSYLPPFADILCATFNKNWKQLTAKVEISLGTGPFWIIICFFSFLFLSAVFHLDSVGSNMTTLWAAEAGLYVGIDNRGNIITSVSTSLFCHFHRLNKASIDIFSITNIDRTATFKIRKKIKWLFTVAFPQRTGDTVSVILNAVKDGRTTTAWDHMISTVSYGSRMSLFIYQQWVSNSFPGN